MKIKILLILLIAALSLMAKSRYVGNSVTTFLHTDRYTYITGDEIFSKVYHIIDNIEMHGKETAIYVDLVDAQYRFITGETFPLINGIAQGHISIPDSLSTGNYFVRVYTNHSKAYTNNEILDIKQLFISNRYGRKGEETNKNPSLDIYDTIAKLPLPEISNKNINITMDDTIYGKRKKVKLQINSSDLALLSGSISIKSTTPYEYKMAKINDEAKPEQILNKKLGLQSFSFSEEKGMSISGRVFHKVSTKPLNNILVLLAVEDTSLQLKYALSNENGDFQFLMENFVGNQEIFLSCYSFPSMELYQQAELHLNKRFLIEENTPHLKSKGYLGSTDSLNLAKSIVNKAYKINIIENNEPKESIESYEAKYLTGKFVDEVDMNDYVELKDFVEISKEILPFVRFRKTDNGYKFVVFDGINNAVYEDPMVFVDGVPLTDNEAIASWGTDKISKVQVQNDKRYYGDVPFEKGMVFIWTKNKDFWSKNELEHTTTTRIYGFQNPSSYTFPDYSKGSKDKNPDFRSILYWNPSFNCSSNSSQLVSFFTSDEVGLFELNFHGVLEDFSTVHIRKHIQVK